MPDVDIHGAASGVLPLAPRPTVPHLNRARFEIDLHNPMHIHQHVLDMTGEAFRTDDFDLFAAFFYLPHQIDTFAVQKTVATHAALREVFMFVREQLEADPHLIRIRDCISAEFTAPDTLICSHVTRIMRGHYQLRDAIPSQSVFRNIGGNWLLTRSSYAIEESDAPFDRLLTRRRG